MKSKTPANDPNPRDAPDLNSSETEVFTIDRLGGRGEGVVNNSNGPIYVPYAAPGDEARVAVRGDRGHLLELIKPGPDRIDPICPAFGVCGGCAVQMLAFPAYAAWKRGLVETPLKRERISTPIDPLVDAHGEGRRRATFHARFEGRDARVGYMEARAHAIVQIQDCPILSPGMSAALPAARNLASVVAHLDKPLDIVVTATETGLDIDLRGLGPLPDRVRAALIIAAQRLDLARLSNHGELLVQRRIPQLTIGRAIVTPPAGVFLQATAAGEQAIFDCVRSGAPDAQNIADLFTGVGSFALRLAEFARVRAVDSDERALGALTQAANSATGLKQIKTERRDLFRFPINEGELADFDAVVLDPPRAGAVEQALVLARMAIPRIVAVSCSATTFARDAAVLIEGGYRLDRVTPIDQFRYSAHVELVGVFSKDRGKRKKRRLLG